MKLGNITTATQSFFRKNSLYTGATFLYTPVLITVLLICKGIYFSIDKKQEEILKKIEDEHLIQSDLALQFARNQNHKKILDLKEQYFPEYVNFGSEDIITENQIETLGKINEDGT